MHAHDQHLLVVGAVEDADAAALRQARVVRQRKSCSSSVALGCLKLKTWQPCGLTPGHHVPDGAVLAGGVHRLEDQQHRVAVGGVEKLLQRAQFLDVLSSSFCSASSTCRPASPRRPLSRGRPSCLADAEVLGPDFHLWIPFAGARWHRSRRLIGGRVPPESPAPPGASPERRGLRGGLARRAHRRAWRSAASDRTGAWLWFRAQAQP